MKIFLVMAFTFLVLMAAAIGSVFVKASWALWAIVALVGATVVGALIVMKEDQDVEPDLKRATDVTEELLRRHPHLGGKLLLALAAHMNVEAVIVESPSLVPGMPNKDIELRRLL